MSEFNYTHDTENFIIRVKTPYNEEFVQKCRDLRGEFNRATSEWVFDDSIEDYIKAALMECFGTTGEGIVQTCSLVIKGWTGSAYGGAVELFGRSIARAFGRDSGAKLCQDIIWIYGDYTSGGSVKHWKTVVNGAFEIQNFPLPRTEFEDVQEAIEEGWCEIKKSKRNRTAEQIQADIDKYEAVLEHLKDELNNF